MAKWSKTEIARLRRLYPNHTNPVIAERLGRTEPSVMQMAIKLGLRKSAALKAGCFPKGHRPWNAGKKGWKAGGNSHKTRFRKGNLPQTWQPVGTERLNKDGYLERKIADPRTWRAVHLLVWEAENGPLPAGHAVVFKNGDKTDIRLDNLECISRQELMRRNSVHRLPKELAEAVQLIGALNRQINARAT